MIKPLKLNIMGMEITLDGTIIREFVTMSFDEDAQFSIKLNTLLKYRAFKKIFKEIYGRLPNYSERVFLRTLAFWLSVIQEFIGRILEI